MFPHCNWRLLEYDVIRCRRVLVAISTAECYACFINNKLLAIKIKTHTLRIPMLNNLTVL